MRTMVPYAGARTGLAANAETGQEKPVRVAGGPNRRNDKRAWGVNLLTTEPAR